MMQNRNPIVKAFERELVPEGFVRTRLVWHRSSDQTIQVADLLKSEFGPKYYLNLAAWISSLGFAIKPAEHKCHVRLRLQPPAVEATFLDAMDLENSISEADRRAAIAFALKQSAIPILDDMRTLAGIRDRILPRGDLGIFMTGSARDLIGQR